MSAQEYSRGKYFEFILAASRHSQNVADECVWNVPGLKEGKVKMIEQKTKNGQRV